MFFSDDSTLSQIHESLIAIGKQRWSHASENRSQQTDTFILLTFLFYWVSNSKVY